MADRTLFEERRFDGTLRARVWLEGERVLASGPDADEHLRDCVLDLSLKLDAALAERDALRADKRNLIGELVKLQEVDRGAWQRKYVEAEARAERAEALAVKLAEEQDERPGGRVTDHACIECVPDMDEQVRERFRDFRCAYHEARALLAPEAQR